MVKIDKEFYASLEAVGLPTDVKISKRIAYELLRKKMGLFAFHAFKVLNQNQSLLWNWHIDLICEYLEAVNRGEIKRLNINIPPRFLKTFLCTQAFSMWYLGNSPEKKIIAITYSAELSKRFQLVCRTIAKQMWYRKLFPQFQIENSQDSKGDDDFLLTQDNMRVFTTTKHGERFATSVGATITGTGCNLVITDDLLSPSQAASDAERQSTLKWVKESVFSRFNNPNEGAIINIQQRLHIDDTTALFEDNGFETLKIPIRNMGDKPIVYNFGSVKKTYKPNEWLQEDRFAEATEKELVNMMGTGAYMAQYAQEPQPEGGNMFKLDWLKYHDLDDSQAVGMNLYILVDSANSKKKDSDYTAMIVVGLNADMNYYIFDIVRDHLNLTERVDKLFKLHNKWLRITNKPPIVGYEKYGMMADTHQIQEQQRLRSYSFTMKELGGKMAKKERIGKLVPLFESGRMLLPRKIRYTRDNKICNLIDEFVDKEYIYYPSSKNDDMLDALARICDDDLEAFFPSNISYFRTQRTQQKHPIW